jgi:2,3-diaminopropionate biosynthesis protein SbnA
MVAVHLTLGGREVGLRLKLESRNTWGSIKDRTAVALVTAVADRLEHPDAVIVESTSGNLGTALAFVATAIGRKFVAVVDPNLSPVLAHRLVEAGARLDVVRHADPQGGFLDARLARIQELLDDLPHAVWTDQYHNPANPLAHYRGTGRELLCQAGDVDVAFVAVSTGGTLAGVSRYLRRHAPRVRVVAVDVPGSKVFGEPTRARILTGIGASRPSSFLRPGDWDDVVLVDDVRAIQTCHHVRRATGLHLGGSSGAVVTACIDYLSAHPELSKPVCICPDSGAAYATTLYDPTWLSAHSIDVTTAIPEQGVSFRRTETWSPS